MPYLSVLTIRQTSDIIYPALPTQGREKITYRRFPFTSHDRIELHIMSQDVIGRKGCNVVSDRNMRSYTASAQCSNIASNPLQRLDVYWVTDKTIVTCMKCL